MADINKLKDKIKSTIYPNGKGAINASDHQAMLLEMADGMAETDTKLANVSAEINGESLQKIEAQSGIGFNPGNKRFPIQIGAGKFKVRLVDDTGVLSITNIPLWLYDKDGNELLSGVSVPKNFVEKSIASDAVSFGIYASAAQVIENGEFYLEFDGETIKKGITKEINDLNAKAKKADSLSESFNNLYYAHGGLNRNEEVANAAVSRSMYLPVSKGDVISSYIYRVKMYDENKIYIGEDLVTSDGKSKVDYTISNDLCKFVRLVCLREFESPILINGEDVIQSTLSALTNPNIGGMYPFASFNATEIDVASFAAAAPAMELRNAINNAILGLWLKNPNESSEYYITKLLYRAKEENLQSDERTYIIMSEKTADGEVIEHILVNDVFSSSINDGVQKYESKDFVFIIDWSKVESGYISKLSATTKYNKLDDIVRKKNNTIYLAIDNGGIIGGTSSNLDSSPYIAMPIPQLAMVNIVGGALPTNKTDDISATLEFNDMQGNVFAKKIIINAQGTSSLGLAKKNFSIDIMDENYEDSHEIKFGDWVAQDGFHLKSYMLDGVRVKPMAVYDFYESILLTRGLRKDRAWKRMQLPSDIPMESNDIVDSYLQLDDGAKNHPSGFPVIVYHNGVFYGIYCWQLKKHRANYHQKKSKAEHIHLDGNISNVLLWEANGVLDWDKWAGKKQESDTSANIDGIEVRNPKKLILTDGTEYDADTNAGELISSTSAKYDSSNADMVRTAAVRANIESLSRRVYALTQMAKGAEKKSAIAEVFDVYSIIDYIIFSQITGNLDGYKKNWQWVTYDGIKWAVNAYDLDGTWGWTSWSYYAPYATWIHNDTPPVTLIIENYLDEIKARYKELRDKGVIDLAKIMQPLVNYVKVIGIDYYNMEFEKWTDGARDNLWRFESWMEESIRRTDVLMDYNKAA